MNRPQYKFSRNFSDLFIAKNKTCIIILSYKNFRFFYADLNIKFEYGTIVCPHIGYPRRGVIYYGFNY